MDIGAKLDNIMKRLDEIEALVKGKGGNKNGRGKAEGTDSRG